MRSQSSVAHDTEIDPVPLGPDSLTWKYFGDSSGFMIGLWAGSMQNMHPKLGAAVEEHSEFFRERIERLMRSIYPIAGVVFDGDRAPQTGREVRDYHRDIKGVDNQGRRYHALDPDVFYWAHATFFMGVITVAERFMGGLTEADKRQLFDEHVQWYRMYGVSMRPVPKTWEDFLIYWDDTCRNVLEDNKATRDVLDLSELGKPPMIRHLPDSVWTLIRPAVARSYVWLTVGIYEEPVRELLGYRWNGRDEWLFRRISEGVTVVNSLIPSRLRTHPRAQAGFDRAAGTIPADAPLIETPRAFLPPIDQWDDPKHYNPYRGQCPVGGQIPMGTGSKI